MENCKAIFLDRDGVLNKSIIIDRMPFSPKNLDETELLPGVKEACDKLHEHGFILICVTNQPDVARKKQSIDMVNAINNYIIMNVPVHDIFTCFHDDCDNCSCRKPKPGLILNAAELYKVDLFNSFMVGDRWRDIDAGKNAGCKTIFIDHNYNEKNPIADYTFKSLLDAVPTILTNNCA